MAVELKETSSLYGHKQRVTSISVPDDSPDTFYTSSRDKKIFQWKLTYSENFAVITKAYEDSTHFVNAIATTRSDKLVSGGADGLARIYDINTKESTCLVGHKRDITCVCINSVDNKIVTGGMDASIALWNTKGELISKLGRNHPGGHQDWITCASFIQGKDMVVTGSADGSIKVWDINSGQVIDTYYKGIPNEVSECAGVTCLSITPDGTLCAYAGRDSEVYIIHLEKKMCIRTFKSESIVYACFFALTETIIALASKELITLCDVVSNKVLAKINMADIEKNTFCTSVAWCKNNLLVGLDNGKIKVFEYNKETL